MTEKEFLKFMDAISEAGLASKLAVFGQGVYYQLDMPGNRLPLEDRLEVSLNHKGWATVRGGIHRDVLPLNDAAWRVVAKCGDPGTAAILLAENGGQP